METSKRNKRKKFLKNPKNGGKYQKYWRKNSKSRKIRKKNNGKIKKLMENLKKCLMSFTTIIVCLKLPLFSVDLVLFKMSVTGEAVSAMLGFPIIGIGTFLILKSHIAQNMVHLRIQ